MNYFEGDTPLRGTGRSTRMVHAAVDKALSGIDVIIVGYVLDMVHYAFDVALDKLLKTANITSKSIPSKRHIKLTTPGGKPVKISFESPKSIKAKNGTFDGVTAHIPELGESTTTFVDHTVIEIMFAEQLKVLHQYDPTPEQLKSINSIKNVNV